jgi:RHS repeat-associated protein
MRLLLTVLLTALLLCYAGTVYGQITGPTTGIAPFGTYTADPTGVVNAANLNIHSVIPIRSKSGFSATLQHESNLWVKATCGGSTCWVHNPPPAGQSFWGRFPSISSMNVGPIFTILGPFCGTDTAYSFNSVDQQGFSHGWQLIVDTLGCQHPKSGSETDMYGYTINANTVTGVYTVTDASGNVVSAATGVGGSQTSTDPNGNVITKTIDSASAYHVTDATSSTVLSVSATNTFDPLYSYTNASGSSVSVGTTTSSFNIKTNFGCPGVLETTTTASLVTSISMPDGSHYSITYEPTPSFPTYTTGRIASITLPAGGTVTYNYNGPNDGITCSDSGTSGFTRTTSDGTWTYARTFIASPGQWQTVITSPSGQKETLLFTGGTGTGFTFEYEVRRVYAEAAGTVVATIDTCYNGNITMSTCAGKSSITGYPTETTVFTGLPNLSGRVSEVDTLYNTAARPTSAKTYDFGNGVPGALLQLVGTNYGSWNGSACAAIGNNITDRICSTFVLDGSTTVAQVLNGYDSKANLLYTASLTSPGNYPAAFFSYNPNGTLATSTGVNGTVTSYSNYLCNGMFPGTVSAGGLSTSATYDCNGGVRTSSTDANGNVTTSDLTLGGADPFWRPKGTIDPLSNETTFYYQPNTTHTSDLAFSSSLTSGSSVVSQTSYSDGLGRKLNSQVQQAPGSSSFDTVSYTYDSNGRLKTTSVPCVGSYVATCPTAAVTNTYDALNRPLTVTDVGGGTTSYVYSNNDVLVSLTGGQTFQKQYEKDGLGRVTSVCEISSAAGSGTCGQVNSKQGFWTKYTYDAAGRLKMITQNAQGTGQTRTFVHDGLGRLTSEVNPESGTTNYTYDTDSVCGSTSARNLIKRVDAAGKTTCYYYDALHRLSAINYPTGCSRFEYDAATNGVNGSAPPGVTVSNVKGQLVEAETDNCGAWPPTPITDEWFSYSARGEVSTLFEKTPQSGGYYTLSMAYWPSGALQTLGGIGLPTITYNLDAEGRPTTVSASSGQSPVISPGTSYNVRGQVTSVALGSGDTVTNGFDANTGRQLSYAETINGTTISGTLTWNSNGTLNHLVVADPFNASDVQTCNYTYDDLVRLASANCGTPWSQTFSYDPFGNLTKNGSITWNPGYSAATNRYTLGGTTYDADGNLLNDTFHTYTWNADNRPATVDAIALTYDAFGRVVEKNNGGVYNQYVYDASNRQIAAMSGQTLVKGLLPLPGGIQATYDPTNSGYRIPDWMGTVRFASNVSRAYTSSRGFAPFGERYSSGGSPPPNFTFTGMINSTVSDEYDFPTRSLQTSQGRWISPDTSGLADISNPQSFNRYAYANGNPLLFTDPTGEIGEPCSPTPDGGGGGCDTSGNMPSLANGECPSGTGDTCIDVVATVDRVRTLDDDLGSWVIRPGRYPQPTLQAPCKGGGGGFGVAVGGDYQAGNGMDGKGAVVAIADGQAGTGVFYDSKVGLSAGNFASGAVAGNGGFSPSAAPKQDMISASAFGTYAGGGVNFFVTNGGSVNQIGGHFEVLSMNVGIGPASLSLNYADSGGIWMASASAKMGPGWGFSVSTFTSNTMVRATPGACQ